MGSQDATVFFFNFLAKIQTSPNLKTAQIQNKTAFSIISYHHHYKPKKRSKSLITKLVNFVTKQEAFMLDR
jgi:hypothetical protein